MSYEKKIQIMLENHLGANEDNQKEINRVKDWLLCEASWNCDELTSERYQELIDFINKQAEEIIQCL